VKQKKEQWRLGMQRDPAVKPQQKFKKKNPAEAGLFTG
jgi:hypothetical protein